MDHAGGVSRVAASETAVLAHKDDVQWLAAGREPRSDSGSLGGRLVNLAGRVLRGSWYRPVKVDRGLCDGEVIPVCGGIRVVHTPGHTPGHVSLLHQRSGVLITGDAVVNVGGLRSAPRLLCANLAAENETRKRLADLEYEIAAFTHGAEIRHNAKAAVDAFVANDPRAR